MKRVANTLRSDHPIYVKLITECDPICSSCPHNNGGKCGKRENSAQQAESRDLAVIDRLGLKPGDEISAQKLWARVKQKITPAALLEICQDCEWLKLGDCLEGLKGLR